MKSGLSVVIAALALALSVPGARADIGINPRVGTLGYGIELSAGLSEKLSLSLGTNGYSYKTQKKSGDVDYDFNLKLRSADLLASYHPFTGAFRLRAGVLFNGNEFLMTGRPSAGQTYDINGTTYTSAQVGTLTGKLSFNKSAPYFGIGWGNRPNGSWGFTGDIGAVYQGKPKLSLEATGAAATAGLSSNLEAERQRTEQDLQSFKWYPVLSFGLYFRF